MCGIIGLLSLREKPVHFDELHAMCDVIAHRGPDDEGYFLCKDAGLGMRRLSIIDLKTGRQPISNEDGSVWVVFNGEIYNHHQLRTELERSGHCFSTATDTETIAHLYEECGEECVQKLRGMFAFALWDAKRRKLLLARDRIGIKPLYYAQINGRLAFASELKSILQLPEVGRDLNWQSVNHLFTFPYTPETESIVEGIMKLEPGHILTAGPQQEPKVRRYWDVSFNPERWRGEEYFVDRLREILQESVKLHLVSDVPVGAFLSGGLDSSSVVASMAHSMSEPVQTFSIGFTEKNYNELRFARQVAKYFGAKHRDLVLEPNVIDIIEDLTWGMDEPFGDSSAIPTYMISKLASEHVKVVLSGDGGDELFAGYDRYLVEESERKYRFIPAPIRWAFGTVGDMLPAGVKGRNRLRHLSFSGPKRYLDNVTLFRHDEKRKLFRNELIPLLSESDPWEKGFAELNHTKNDWLSALQCLDLKSYLPLDILTKVDRMSMAHSLEVRVPLLDHKVIEFVATIPPELKLHNRTTKYIFKQAMRGILPGHIIDRPKKGFAIPLGGWFRGKLESFIHDLLLSETSRRRGIFNLPYIGQLLDQHKRGKDLDMQLWSLISFEMWCRTFLDNSLPREIRRTRAPSVARVSGSLGEEPCYVENGRI